MRRVLRVVCEVIFFLPWQIGRMPKIKYSRLVFRLTMSDPLMVRSYSATRYLKIADNKSITMGSRMSASAIYRSFSNFDMIRGSTQYASENRFVLIILLSNMVLSRCGKQIGQAGGEDTSFGTQGVPPRATTRSLCMELLPGLRPPHHRRRRQLHGRVQEDPRKLVRTSANSCGCRGIVAREIRLTTVFLDLGFA